MLDFKKLSIRNFMSFGNEPQTIDLGGKLWVVMGINLDSDRSDARNGTGKSSIMDAFCYALFGSTARGISNPKLVNKMIRKGQNMLVTLEFSDDTHDYLIERGEKPSVLRLFRKPKTDSRPFKAREEDTFVFDVSKSKPETNQDIINILGFNKNLFNILVCNTSDDIPFPKLPESERRQMIEAIMGFDKLGVKADAIKEQRKKLKSELAILNAENSATEAANNRIREKLASIRQQHEDFEKNKTAEIEEIEREIRELTSTEYDQELHEQIITLLNDLKDLSDTLHKLQQERVHVSQSSFAVERERDRINNRLDMLVRELDALENGTCHTCGQPWHDDERMEKVVVEIETLLHKLDRLDDPSEDLERLEQEIKDTEEEIRSLLDEVGVESISELELVKSDLDTAKEASELCKRLEEEKQTIQDSKSPYVSIITDLETSIVPIDTSRVAEYNRLISHMDYLIDLLQSKDSFIRKSIISRQASYLNRRIKQYLVLLELPFNVYLNENFDLIILNKTGTFDWGNLSKGQRHRVTMALNLAFQDLWYHTKEKINLLMIDELLDSGLCASGASAMMNILNDRVHEHGLTCLLVTHRQELQDRADNMLSVIYRNGLSVLKGNEDLTAV